MSDRTQFTFKKMSFAVVWRKAEVETESSYKVVAFSRRKIMVEVKIEKASCMY